MKTVQDIAALEALYGVPMPIALGKVTPRLTPLYRRWIGASRFVVLATVGPDGTDASPRGDAGPVVRIVDDHTLWLPDWRGNNRIDTLRNIVRDGRMSMMFMVPGSNNVVRVNGTAVVCDDPAVTGQLERAGTHPRSVVVMGVREVYFQCAKAVMRAELWHRDDADGLPSAGDFVTEQHADFDGAAYDIGYPDYARDRMW